MRPSSTVATMPHASGQSRLHRVFFVSIMFFRSIPLSTTFLEMAKLEGLSGVSFPRKRNAALVERPRIPGFGGMRLDVWFCVCLSWIQQEALLLRFKLSQVVLPCCSDLLDGQV